MGRRTRGFRFRAPEELQRPRIRKADRVPDGTGAALANNEPMTPVARKRQS
jgi:hypothetical protein